MALQPRQPVLPHLLRFQPQLIVGFSLSPKSCTDVTSPADFLLEQRAPRAGEVLSGRVGSRGTSSHGGLWRSRGVLKQRQDSDSSS